MQYTVIDVLRHFYPNSEYLLMGDDDYSTLQWNSTLLEKPTEETINQLKDEMHYLTAREMMYPPISEQLDSLWHDINNSSELQALFPTFYNKIKDVKDLAPKSEIEPTIIHYPTTLKP
jgi:hypothetical protein